MSDDDTLYLTQDELAAWQAEIASVKPLASVVKVKQEPLTQKAPRSKKILSKPSPVKTSPSFSLIQGEYRSVDKATVKRIKRRQLPVDRTIDLHGLRQEEAFQFLQYQLMEAVLRREKLVLVITGKGRSGESVLKQRLPDWLNDEAIRPYLLAFDVARPQDGGSGAFYVLLKTVKVIADEADFGDR